jgi:excisionase family DNA binding protein
MHDFHESGQHLSNRTFAALRWRSVEPAITPTAAGFPPVLTAAMAAELLQVNVEYLRRMVREERIPCHRFPGGREMRFLRDELLAWLAALPGDDQSSSSGRTHQTDPIGT